MRYCPICGVVYLDTAMCRFCHDQQTKPILMKEGLVDVLLRALNTKEVQGDAATPGAA